MKSPTLATTRRKKSLRRIAVTAGILASTVGLGGTSAEAGGWRDLSDQTKNEKPVVLGCYDGIQYGGRFGPVHKVQTIVVNNSNRTVQHVGGYRRAGVRTNQFSPYVGAGQWGQRQTAYISTAYRDSQGQRDSFEMLISPIGSTGNVGGRAVGTHKWEQWQFTAWPRC